MSRRRRIAKWAGLVLCAVTLSAWFASVVWAVPVQQPQRSWGFIVGDGGVAVWWGMRVWLTAQHKPVALIDASGGTGFHWPRRLNFVDGSGVLRIPFWMILVPFVIPTAWLWWRDSQVNHSGACGACGYDLTGNESGICPECGTKIR